MPSVAFLVTAGIAACLAIVRLDVTYREGYETRWLNDTLALYALRVEGLVAIHVAYIGTAHRLWRQARRWSKLPAESAEPAEV